MATATTLTRPSHVQSVRARRDNTRPHLNKRPSAVDTMGETSSKRRKINEPYVRTSEYLLQKFRGRPPSLVIHLHQNYFRFEGQEGSFPLDSPMKFVLGHLRHQTVPHEMIEELLANNVPFYDGCLIVEVHNHRSTNGKDKSKRDSAHGGDAVKFSMHNFDGFITPSPLVPYPTKAKIEETVETVEKEDDAKAEASKQGKGKEGPTIATIVLHPTPLSRHHEMLLLMRTPASDAKNKRKSTDVDTPSTGQPPTPQLTVPPVSLGNAGRSGAGQNQKMCLEEKNRYEFEAELLLATEPPLYLDPVDNVRDAQKVLDLLAHPLHSEPAPSPKTRKRTTAEMAADDAQAAEAERRMLIMDERIKPSARAGTGAASGDNQGTAASYAHSRFKTLQMVREKQEEDERIKKEEEARAALERRQQEEANAAAVQQQQAAQTQLRLMQANKQREALAARARQQQQQQQQQQEAQIRAQQIAAAQLANQSHIHQQQTNMMQGQAQANFTHPTPRSQTSPVVRQQTPMINSSPMVAQNGFPMTATSSQQGAGSPPRPGSAVMANQNMGMTRQVSQQQHPSRINTPQIPQGTPNIQGQAMPNRQMSATPRMPHGSPAPGTPVSATLSMQTPNQAHMRPEQRLMLQQVAQQHNNMQNHQGGMMHAGSPGQQTTMGSMTPEQIQNIRQQQPHLARTQAQLQAQLAAQQLNPQQMNPQQMQNILQQRQVMLRQQALMAQQQQQQQQQRIMQQQQQNASLGQAGSPGMGMQSAQMNLSHSQQGGSDINGAAQQMNPQQRQQMQMRAAQLQLHSLATKYHGIQNIPAQVVSALPPLLHALLQRQRQLQQQQQQQQQQQAINTQQMARRAQQSGQAVVGSNSGGDPNYMQQLQAHRAMLAQAQAQAQQQGMAGMNLNMNAMQGFGIGGGGQGGGQNGSGGGGGAGGGDDALSREFAAMSNALQRQQGNGNLM